VFFHTLNQALFQFDLIFNPTPNPNVAQAPEVSDEQPIKREERVGGKDRTQSQI
jgi:hypothetical protein